MALDIKHCHEDIWVVTRSSPQLLVPNFTPLRKGVSLSVSCHSLSP